MNVQETVLRAFGEGSDEEQGKFINSLAYALKEACVFDKSKEENQTCYITKYLDKHGSYFVQQLAEFVKYREEPQ